MTGDDIIGSRLMIESEGVEPMGGTVVRYNPATGEHDVLLDSGLTVTLDLNEEEVMVDDGSVFGGDEVSDYGSQDEEEEEEEEEQYYEPPPPRRSTKKSPSKQRSHGNRNYHIASYSDDDDNKSVASTGSAIRENHLYQKKKVRRGGEIVGFNVCIFNNDDPDVAPLEGVITSYDPHTACHGVAFDTGLELDIDLAEENVSLTFGDDVPDSMLALHALPLIIRPCLVNYSTKYSEFRRAQFWLLTLTRPSTSPHKTSHKMPPSTV